MHKYSNFLQSNNWREFQEKVGQKTFNISKKSFEASIIEHKLPVVGKYFYVPRGLILRAQNEKLKAQSANFSKLINLAKEKKSGWVRVDIKDKNDLDLFTELVHELNLKIKKAPHDMQPKQIFKIDISGSSDELLAKMKPKTRYNIKLAKKKGVEVRADNDKINEFIRLVKITSKRSKIKSHPDDYYRKMLEIPGTKLYLAYYKGEVIAAAIIAFYKNTATYLHGGSENEYRNVMAPFLLQWQAILDAKKEDYVNYDFGGVKVENDKQKVSNGSWAGITRFKLGFSKSTKPIDYLGSYDIVINSSRYNMYRFLQRIKSVF